MSSGFARIYVLKRISVTLQDQNAVAHGVADVLRVGYDPGVLRHLDPNVPDRYVWRRRRWNTTNVQMCVILLQSANDDE